MMIRWMKCSQVGTIACGNDIGGCYHVAYIKFGIKGTLVILIFPFLLYLQLVNY
ncbi:hypothetical protein BCR33DRAFT_675476 [Rhizoclosmatium globosum]|uniref:Uncharacterized protein n=1 Tax=Rhizoclosmatium globosum TaxID=329046 RepID=A0A1Y2CZW0_9FUNG|nr:hypothetical protein BCR33DRAFT_675476 [Rhizoclosmatium globosum]|eukprot:ORY52569.1 hypothetical protein BCR33DRAFT_675476 [Rhizoclosmatium globosum]